MRGVVLITAHWLRHYTRDTSRWQSYYISMAQSSMLPAMTTELRYRLPQWMDFPMSRGGYSHTVQMRIGKKTITGLHLVQPQCMDSWRLLGCYSCMVYTLTLQTAMAILRFTKHL